MAYNKDFYAMYMRYLKESVVRENHDAMFRLFASLICSENPRVIDLGCGLGEYVSYDEVHAKYFGVDLNATGIDGNFLQADYTKLDFGDMLPFTPNAFISLFSIELFNSAEARYTLYKRVFSQFPSVNFGLVAGFFYESKRDLEVVEETGGITSHQTIEDPSLFISDVFTELRICLKVPSVMFGDDVIEVWKILVRK